MNTGVYKITNDLTSKFYIGSSSRDITKRWYAHRYRLKKQIHCNVYLQNAWNKYGAHNFKFEILELCAPKLCIAREQYYLDLLKPTYNLNPIAGSRLGIKHTKETKEKISKGNLGVSRGLGRKNTDKTKNLMRRNRSHIIIKHYDPSSTLLRTYYSRALMAEALQLCRKTVAKILNGDTVTKYHKLYLHQFKITNS